MRIVLERNEVREIITDHMYNLFCGTVLEGKEISAVERYGSYEIEITEKEAADDRRSDRTDQGDRSDEIGG